MAKRYFIINPAGQIHEVTKTHATRLVNSGKRYRMATKAEVERHFARVEQQKKLKKQGISRGFAPLVPEWASTAEPQGYEPEAYEEKPKEKKGKAK